MMRVFRSFVQLMIMGWLAHTSSVFAGPTNAVFLNGTTSLTAMIAYDTQSDWYEMQVLPYWSYSLTITTNTLWDSSVQILSADGGASIVQTDSVANGQSCLTWTNNGSAGCRYIHVEGFAQFTTGLYTLALQAHAPVDTYGNGLPDAWQSFYFGSVSPTNFLHDDPDGDGVANGDELLAGTSPADALSVLVVQEIDIASSQQWLIAWPAVPYGDYVLEQASSPLGPWVYLASRGTLQESGVLTQQIDGVVSSTLVVRVKLVY